MCVTVSVYVCGGGGGASDVYNRCNFMVECLHIVQHVRFIPHDGSIVLFLDLASTPQLV